MIVEIIGLAGAGKTTLAKTLSERTNDVRLESLPSYWKIDDIPFFVRNTFALLPALYHIYIHNNGKHLSWKHLIYMLTLNGWHKELKKKELKDNRIFILDQGPIYIFMTLTLFGPERIRTNHNKIWWNQTFQRWAETLDTVIWIDASIPELIRRNRAREKKHSVKFREDNDAYHYLESFRHSYELVMADLLACSSQLKVVRLDTEKNSLDQTVNKIINNLCLQ